MFSEDQKQLGMDVGLLWLRLTTGGFMLVMHGWGKMLKLFADGPIKFADPIGLGAGPSLVMAVGAEVLCAALLIVGLATRFAAMPLLITMIVAAFVVHGADPFQKKEFALLYAIPYLTLILTGPGRFSIDHWWMHRREHR